MGCCGILRDWDAGKHSRGCWCWTPLFLMWIGIWAMLPYVTKEEFQDIGTKLLDYGPQMGGDFLQVGQEMLTPEIRRELIGLQGFEFSFRGNQEFEPWRVKAMEEMVHRQIQAILRGGGLQTKDVFVPQAEDAFAQPAEGGQEAPFDNGQELLAAELLAGRLREVEGVSAVMEEIAEGCSKNGSGVPAGQICAGNLHFAEVYQEICQIVDGIG